MRDFLWGNDVGPWREFARVSLKIVFALLAAWTIHEGLARTVFFTRIDPVPFAKQVNELLCTNGIDVEVTISWKDSPQYSALTYELARKLCPNKVGTGDQAAKAPDDPAAETASVVDTDAQSAPQDITVTQGSAASTDAEPPDFYRLWREGVTHPQVTESVHVFVRRVEKEWKGTRAQELLLCAESRKALAAQYCAQTESFRQMLAGDVPVPATSRSDEVSTGAAPSIAMHLQKIKLGSLVLGPWQWFTLAAFIFALVEVLGLRARWLRSKSFVDELVEKGLEDKLGDADQRVFEERLAVASDKSVRALIDRFLEKALAPSNTTAETRLRNFRDMLVDDCVSKLDSLESIGDTMLKIAFMGTVYGIGTALFAARSLDAADPLIRLVAKSEMYAGIGMGFGATLVGILLSILAAMLRSWLSGSWLSMIDDAWRRATMFYDANYGSHDTQKSVKGVHLRRIGYRDVQKSGADRAVDAFLITLGYLGVLAGIAYLIYAYWIRFGGGQ